MATSNPADSSMSASATTPSLKRTPTDQRTCWICMDSASENPEATWANPCNCSLEAHEACLLRWIAESEQSAGRVKNGLFCPQCKALIRIEEPHDSFISLRDQLHRAYSKVSPVVLVVFLSSGAMAGSAWYGLMATNIFAGSTTTARWLTSNGALLRRRSVSLLWFKPFWVFHLNLWIMSLVGPTLTIIGAFPPVINLIFLPASVMYGSTLILQNKMPSWPITPDWALVIMPVVHLTYQSLYYQWFGGLEKRLNRALRGRPETDEPRALEQQQPGAAGGDGNGARQQEQEDEPGTLATIFALSRHLWAIWRNNGNNEAEEEGPVPAEDDGDGQDRNGQDQEQGHDEQVLNQVLEDLIEVEERLNDQVAEAANEAEQAAEVEAIEEDELARIQEEAMEDLQAAAQAEPILDREAEPAANGNEEFPEEPEAQERAPPARRERERDRARDQDQERAERAERVERRERRRQRHRQERQERQERRRNRNGQRNANQNQNRNQNEGEERGPSFLAEICSSVVTSLMYPAISYGMGELIRLAAPKAWVANPGRRPASGLLQKRWGRSLVGGCLYVVVRDALVLYTKYRRVQVKKNRRVRNVDSTDHQAS